MSELSTLERVSVTYDIRNIEIINAQRNIISEQIRIKELQGINIIYDNQSRCSVKINEAFKDKKIINVLVYGKTQTGKTGCMTSFIKQYVLSHSIPIENIYIITGLSDIAWKNDTINRMPDAIYKRVYHRANLPKTFADEIKSKKNLLIIMDEIQIASTVKQTISKTFKKCMFYDLKYLLENDIKLVQFSATPDGHIYDIADWKDHSKKIKLQPGEGYIGSIDLLKEGRVRQFKQLWGWDIEKDNIPQDIKENILEIKRDIITYKNARYHTIRIPCSKDDKDQQVIINFKLIFGISDYNYNTSFLKVKKGDINSILSIKPEKHTFIFIKEILRCAKTKIKTYLGIEYERYALTIADSTIMQGSIGRLTGYDGNKDLICYTNIDTIKRYEELWKSNFQNNKIEWNSKTTTNKKGIISSKGTYNSINNYNGSSITLELRSQDRGNPTIKTFKDQKYMIKWFKNNLKEKMNKSGPRIKNIQEDGINKGFYLGSIRGGYQILSQEKVKTEQRWGFKLGPGYRSFPCYSDTKDPTTLEWWLIYYEK